VDPSAQRPSMGRKRCYPHRTSSPPALRHRHRTFHVEHDATFLGGRRKRFRETSNPYLCMSADPHLARFRWTFGARAVGRERRRSRPLRTATLHSTLDLGRSTWNKALAASEWGRSQMAPIVARHPACQRPRGRARPANPTAGTGFLGLPDPLTTSRRLLRFPRRFLQTALPPRSRL
jgi:hypothetical protein